MACATRRLKNESKKWETEFNNENRHMTLLRDTVFIYFMNIGNIKDIIFEVRCGLPSEYPFKPPKITYNLGNGKKSMTELYKLSRYESAELKTMNIGMDCLCCYTILCGDNWDVCLKMVDIGKELERLIKLRQRIRKRMMARKVQRKEMEIPSDLWNLIISYL